MDRWMMHGWVDDRCVLDAWMHEHPVGNSLLKELSWKKKKKELLLEEDGYVWELQRSGV